MDEKNHPEWLILNFASTYARISLASGLGLQYKA
jgi:hypothetical protein